MGLLLSPTQREHLTKGKELFFSPEAIALRDDPVLGGANQKLAALDHFMSGWKKMEPRYGAKGELAGYNLAVDNVVPIDALEAKQQEIAETKRFMQDGEIADMFSSLTDDEIGYLRSAAEEFISGGAIDKVGELGTKNRTYPTDYKDPALRGKVIPAVFEPGQKRERGLSLLTDKMQNIDKDTGVGTYGNSVDALHREAAANNPALLTDIGNIRMGNSSLNQSVKEFEGEELKNSLLTRLLRLNDEQFFLENGVRPAPADKGSLTKKEDLAFAKLSNAIDKELDTINTQDAESFVNNRMAGDMLSSLLPGNVELTGRDSNRGTGERDLNINSGGGNVTIGDNALRKNGKNGNH